MNSYGVIDHPLADVDHVIETPQIVRVAQKIQEWVWVDQPGGFIFGPPRTGKTMAVEHIGGRITTRSGGFIPFFYACPQRDVQKTDRKFWSHLLLAFGQRITRSKTAIQCYEELLGLFGERSTRNSERQVILCLDEAQYMNRKELELLMCLYNELRHLKIRLFVLQVGTPQLKERQKSLAGSEHAHLKGRFFNSGIRVLGCRSEAELHAFLALYDDDQNWSGSASPSTVFFDGTCLEGCRMAEFTSEFWHVFQVAIRPEGFDDWPTFYLVSGIRNFLIDFVPRIQRKEDCLEYVSGAVASSGIVSLVEE